MNVNAINYSRGVSAASTRIPVAPKQAATADVAPPASSPAVPAGPVAAPNAPVVQTDAPPAAEIEVDDHAGEEQDHTKGVIRLLEAGHFKGVADVRLRINFFDELSARATQSAQSTATEQAGQLVGAVTSKADELLSVEGGLTSDENQQAVSDLLAQFENAANTAVTDGLSSKTFNSDSLAGALRSAFDSLVEQVAALLAPPAANEPDVAGPPSADSPASPTLDDALASLRTAFEAALTTFIGSVQTASQLPPLSPPHGRGKAYDKFLSIYNSLLYPTSTTNEQA